MRRYLSLALLLTCLAVPTAIVGCQQAPPPRPIICCPKCGGQKSDKCPWCHGHPYEPERWGR